MLRVEREVRRLEGMSQLAFGFDRDASADERLLASDDQLFLDPEPHDLFVGAQRLERYLIDNDLAWVVRLAAVLKELDYSALVGAYSVAGRCALHPRVILGLVVYGILSRNGLCASWRLWPGVTWAPGGSAAAINQTTVPLENSSSCTLRF